jgi:hypothetical protein
MKKIVVLTLLFASVLYAQTPPLGTNTKIATTWVAVDNGNPACSATVTKACVWGRTLTIIPPTGVTTGNTVIPSCSATVTTGCINAMVTTYTWTSSTNLYCGTWGVSLATNYLDGNGSAQVTASSATVSAVEPCPFVPPGSPKSISVSFQ